MIPAVRFSFLSLFLLGSLLLLGGAAPLSAQDGGFRTVLDVSFGYSGGKTDEPLLAIAGVPAANYAYRADSTERRLEVSATRFLTRVPDDGRTPYALLSYVAHPSFLSARVGLGQTSRDSAGFNIGSVSTLDARLSGDLSRNVGELRGAYSWGALELTGALAAISARETASTTSTEIPSGRASFGSFGTRTSELDVRLGGVLHFGPEASVGLEGTLRDVTTRRSDRTVFSGGGNALAQELLLEGEAFGVALAGRKLLLSRRLALDGAFSYEVTRAHLDLTEPSPSALDAGRFIDRRFTLTATHFFTRALDLAVGGSYRTGSDVAGLSEKRRSASRRSVVLFGALRWFVRPLKSVTLAVSRTRAESSIPPDSETFQKLVDTVDRVELTGSIRF
ncbi:MAG: hypothetical protein ABIT01_12165 [Thermoanaerobaculia bacterium]